MKTFTSVLLIITVFAFLSACKKENNGSRTPLTGIWRSTEGFADPGGGGGIWQPIAAKDQVIVQFDTDGRLEGTAFPEYVNYKLKDSVTVTFTSDKSEVENYRFSISDGTLTMSPAGPIVCTEGCATRFVKVK